MAAGTGAGAVGSRSRSSGAAGANRPKSGAWKGWFVGGGGACRRSGRTGSAAEKRGSEIVSMRGHAFGWGRRDERRDGQRKIMGRRRGASSPRGGDVSLRGRLVVARGSDPAAGRRRFAPARPQRWDIPSNGLGMRSCRDPKSTRTAAVPSTRVTRPSPYASCTTRSPSAN